MIRRLFSSLTHRFAWRIPLFVYGATWTLFLTITVAIVSLAPEFAFVSAIYPSSSYSMEFSRRCGSDAAVLVPLDLPTEVLCLPANLFRRSKMDLVVPPVFAAVVVRTMGLWAFGRRMKPINLGPLYIINTILMDLLMSSL